MPAGQQYGTNVPQTFATAPISAGATSIPVNSSSGWPSTPFTAIFEIGTSLQEAMDVTSVAGTNWTVVRGIDGTTALSHAINATITHGNIGRDFREARSHIDASTNVHGLGGASSVVGTTDTQNLSNKTLVAPTISGATSMGSGAWTGTGNLSENTFAFAGISGASAASSRLAGSTTAAGPPTTGTFVAGDIVVDQVTQILWFCTAGGSPGTWAPMVESVQSNAVTFSGSTNTTTVTLPTALTPYFTSLKILVMGSTSFGSGDEALNMRFNADSAAHYAWQYSGWTNNTSATSSQGATASQMIAGFVGGSGGTGHTIIDVPGYKTTVSNAFRTVSYNSTATGGLAASVNNLSIVGGGTWNSSSAITSFTIFSVSGSNFSANTTVSAILYK